METFRRRFTKIQDGFSTNRRIPRLGKIRLGLKVKNAKGVEYPKETEHFVVPDEVRRVYGDMPRELDVLLPVDDPEIVFPQSLVMYGSSRGLKCHGNGQTAERLNEQTGKWEERSCPCEFRKTDQNPKGQCDEVAHLMVILPKVNAGGVYQLTTRSYHSAVDINSGIDFVRGLIGRVALVPLKLKREARDTHHDGKKQVHYTCTLTLDADINGINRLREDNGRVLETARYQIEAPVEESPVSDPPDVVEVEEVVTVLQPSDIPEEPHEEVMDFIREQVTILTKSSHGARQLRALNKKYGVKDYTKLTEQDRPRYFQDVSTEVEALTGAEHSYA